MKHLILCLILALAPFTATAQESTITAAQEDTIAEAIMGQFNAFEAGDIDSAFAYASPGIQGYFLTAENFARMVRTGYGVLYENETVQLTDQRQSGILVIQKVLVIDTHRVPHAFEFEMIETRHGWKINGVHRLAAPAFEL